MTKKKPKRKRAGRNPIAKAVRGLAPKVKPVKRRPPPDIKDWNGDG